MHMCASVQSVRKGKRMTRSQQAAQHAICWLILIVSLAGVAPLTAAQQAAPPASAERIAILGVKVLDHEPGTDFTAIRNFFDRKAAPATGAGTGASTAPQKLIGAGDLVISVALTDKVALSQPALKPLELFVNGVPLGDDAKLVAIEDSDTRREYRYYIAPGKLSNNLWSAIFREVGLYRTTPLRVGLGWNGEPHSYPVKDAFGANTVQISHLGRIAFASFMILAFIAAWVYVIRATDTFRDMSPPAFWRRALVARRAFREAADKEAFLKRDAGYDPAKAAEYDWQAARALDGAPLTAEQESAAVLGLIRAPRAWTIPRASYSLGRLQFGLWLLFAVSVGVFLWIVYGDLPGLENSIITILGFSMAVTAASLYVDQHTERPQFTPSNGFWRDLTTGFDEKQKVYRFQAVVVNLLLLFIGVYQVINLLTYPTFDPTWLALIGLSGVFLTAGKSLSEVVASPTAAPAQEHTGPAGSAAQTPAGGQATEAGAGKAPPPLQIVAGSSANPAQVFAVVTPVVPAGGGPAAKTDPTDKPDLDPCGDACGVDVREATPDDELPAAAGGIRR
jgi:hypothetical protein